MIDHISVGVADLERSARFYETTLASLGLTRLVTRTATIGFGKNYPEFWINLRAGMAPVAPESGTHRPFTKPSFWPVCGLVAVCVGAAEADAACAAGAAVACVEGACC